VFGSGGQKLNVEVDVIPLPEPQAEAMPAAASRPSSSAPEAGKRA